MADGRERVLHVVESYGGGVAAAMGSYLAAVPGVEHWLLVRSRPGCPVALPVQARAAEVFTLPDGHLARVRAVAAAYDWLSPQWVHAHSSLAGVYTRLAWNIPARAIVYTPHCYAFERLDISPCVRLACLLAEGVLARRTGTVAACGPREAELAARLNRAQRVVHVPNVAPSAVSGAEGAVAGWSGAPAGGRPVAVAVGRVCRQKDPVFFARAAACVPGALTWVWVGDGGPARGVLQDAGVTVTGWLPRSEVLSLLRSADVYVHTAAWEGVPLSLLEAAAAGLPVAARDIPALAALCLPDLSGTPQELAATAVALASEGPARERHRVRLAHALRRHTPLVQAACLERVYGLPSSPSQGSVGVVGGLRVAVSSKVLTRACGGNSTYAVAVYERLARRGVEVRPLWPGLGRTRGLRRAFAYGVADGFLASSSWAAGDADVVHFPADTGALWRAGAVPVVATVHGVASLHHAVRRPVAARVWQARAGRLAGIADAVVTVSRSSADDLMRAFQVPGDRIHVIPHGVDAGRFHPDASRDAPVLEPYRLPDRFLLYLGNLEPRKNLRALVEALEDRHLAGVGMPLVVAGARAWEANATFTAIAASPRTRYLGPVPDSAVGPLLRAATAFVFPSLYEGFGLPVLEAMACGTPVITTRAGGLPEVTGEAALTVPDPTPGALAAAVAELLGDDALAAQLRREGMARARAFSWEASAAAHHELFASVADRWPGRRRSAVRC
ncbi:glycosyltransferase [Streptomyces sp. UNOC14_S4]|uniref:glycosyltransferase n=1 Tax=Streptomyces sp. UNOC14_S4 TaxID=2872340 RepID=UPI001E647F94|nr:glycosyltransferase [Streptomyces sp. UNOC14_S4]MCC3768841.1 glycosyltransferase [Streptomyces sp. UNOC14_S4]